MSEICCADKDPYTSPERLNWWSKQEFKAGREWVPWTGECYCPEGAEYPCQCLCKCEPLKPNDHCYCVCDGCICSEYVSWRNPQRPDDLLGRE